MYSCSTMKILKNHSILNDFIFGNKQKIFLSTDLRRSVLTTEYSSPVLNTILHFV